MKKLELNIEQGPSPFTLSVLLKNTRLGKKTTVSFAPSDILELYIIESIESAFRTARIKFRDNSYFHELLPFTGNEKVVINLGQKLPNSTDKSITFDIYKINRIDASTEGRKIEEMDIQLVETGWYEFVTKKVSQSFKNKKSTEIISSLVSNETDIELNIMEKSETSYPLFISPISWTIMQTTKYLLNRSKGKNGGWGWLMWSSGDTSSKLNLITIEKLLNDIQQKKSPDEKLVLQSTYNYTPSRILHYEMKPIDKFLLTRFMGGSTYYGYNRENRTFGKWSTTLDKDLKKMNTLGKQKLFTTDWMDETGSVETVVWNSDKDAEIHHMNKMSLDYSNQQQMDIITYGWVNRNPGMAFDINWQTIFDPGTQQFKEEKFNKALKGRWMVHTITHYYKGPRSQNEGPEYMNKVRLIKNAFSEVQDSNLIT